jgi:hypothetical protein
MGNLPKDQEERWTQRFVPRIFPDLTLFPRCAQIGGDVITRSAVRQKLRNRIAN